jgi:hypothetical protein
MSAMLPAKVEGPWAIDLASNGGWAIFNQLSGKRKLIGPAGYKKGRQNYFDVANAEATRRNMKLLKVNPDAPAQH